MLQLIGLLSRIRLVRNADLISAARTQYLFPAVGAILGVLVAIVAYLLFQLTGEDLSSLVVALISVLFLYFVYGLMHLEGLSDFGDGLMASGDITRKQSAMKDTSLGAAGCFFMVVDLLLLVLLISEMLGKTGPRLIFGAEIPLIFGFVLAEVSAKLSMLTVIHMGPSSHEGMGSIFVSQSSGRIFAVGLAISLIVSFLIAGIYFPIVLIGILSGFLITQLSRRHFGGVGGDAFGAANELGRLAALFVWVLVL